MEKNKIVVESTPGGQDIWYDIFKKKKLPTYLLTTVTHIPNRKFYRGAYLSVAICAFIVALAAGVLLFGDWLLDFWRL